jgi:hypothetical protein
MHTCTIYNENRLTLARIRRGPPRKVRDGASLIIDLNRARTRKELVELLEELTGHSRGNILYEGYRIPNGTFWSILWYFGLGCTEKAIEEDRSPDRQPIRDQSFEQVLDFLVAHRA